MTAAVTAPALAGQQYVDESGFALSGYDPVAYFALQQSPPGAEQPAPVRGDPTITADWNGATWAFASAENRDLFMANPAHYAPQFDGHCAFGVAGGAKVPGNPNLWRIEDDKLYLNITPSVAETWSKDIGGNIAKAGENWPSLEPSPASEDKWSSLRENGGGWFSWLK